MTHRACAGVDIGLEGGPKKGSKPGAVLFSTVYDMKSELAVSDVGDVRKMWEDQRFSDTDRIAHSATPLGTKLDHTASTNQNSIQVTMPSIFIEINWVQILRNIIEYDKN
jgi:hypothetical protein